MEMRECQRRPMDREVLVQASPTAAHACRLKDLTLDGAYVAGGSAAGLETGAVVSLGINVSDDGGIRRFVVPARVVRTAPGGAGLRLGAMDLGAYSALLNLLFPATPDSRAGQPAAAVTHE
jgi:hypothetical protein